MLPASGLLRFARNDEPASGKCPQELGTATQLLLAAPKDMAARAANLVRFERAGAGAPWKRAGELPVVLGWAGTRWAWNTAEAKAGLGPIKREGDGATPAGIFPVGAPFGFAPASHPDYMRLKAGEQFCVSEPQSPSYNSVIEPKPAGLKGEDMGAVSLYRRGLFIGYPTNRAARGGSCLFIHVWRSPRARTDGCVAASEEDVAALQNWVHPKQALIAILPEEDAKRLARCIGQAFAQAGPPPR
jgi:L,D-transpeptidase catalytic domain